jgi:hypothetical protein
MTLHYNGIWRNGLNRYTQHILYCAVILNVGMLTVIILSVFMLSIFMLSIVMLNVVA